MWSNNIHQEYSHYRQWGNLRHLTILIEYPRIEAEKATYEVHEYPDLIRLKMQKPEASFSILEQEDKLSNPVEAYISIEEAGNLSWIG